MLGQMFLIFYKFYKLICKICNFGPGFLIFYKFYKLMCKICKICNICNLIPTKFLWKLLSQTRICKIYKICNFGPDFVEIFLQILQINL